MEKARHWTSTNFNVEIGENNSETLCTHPIKCN